METLKMRAKRIVIESPALAKEIARQLRTEPAGLTDRQMKALNFLRDFHDKHGLSPTYSETAEALGVSRTAAFDLIHRLQERGHVQMLSNRCRSIVLMDGVAA